MSRKVTTTILLILSVTTFVLAVAVPGVRAPAGPSYTMGASPATVNEEVGNVVITFTISGGTANTAYTFRFTVTKPGGAGQAYCDESFPTNSTGGYTQVLTYPNNSPSWNAITGTAQTDVPGNYNVTVVETSPKSVTTGLPSVRFSVTSALTVSIITPTQGITVQRGTTENFAVTVGDINGQPVPNAQVYVSIPGGGQLGLTATTPSGTYSGSYPIQKDDPLGSWNITATAYSPTPSTTNNFGSDTISLIISPSQLIISNLSTYNQYGTPTADFSAGDTLYATFTIGYPFASGGSLSSGSFTIRVEDPSGTTATSLSAIYDPYRNLFYTPSGFRPSASDTAGSWELAIPAQSLNDAYGNAGPATTITYRFVVHQDQSQVVVNPFYYLVIALALGGGLGTALFFKKFNSTIGPFDDLFKLTGGEMRAPGTLMITSDSGAGSTTMALELLHRDLARGKACGLISYDGFPAEITRRMRDMGWDITDYVKTGQLKILDCYSALAGVEGSLIKDATDFTEVSIQVSAMIEKARGPVTILLDSVTPIFNSAMPKDCINFLQVLGAKVKNSGGIFIFTATKGSIPEEARSKIEALADGVIELSLIKKSQSLRRTLQVKKMAGHQTSTVETGFEIVQGRGIMMRRQRVPIGLFRT
jgi:KaiC/GvpD/RAD55 family RecA-like ATPase